MKNKGRNKSKGIVIFFLLIVAMVILIISKSEFTTGKVEVNNSNNNKEEHKMEYSLGDIVNVGAYRVQVRDLNNEESKRKNYIVLNLTVENTSDKPIEALGKEKNFLEVTDNDGTHGINFDGTLDLEDSMNSKEHSLLSSDKLLNPHTTYTGNIVFENNKEITSGEVNLKIDDKEIMYKL